MAVTYSADNKESTIICDKCGATETVSNDEAGKRQLFYSGWILKSSANKYKNRCWNCLTSSEKKTQEWAQNHLSF